MRMLTASKNGSLSFRRRLFRRMFISSPIISSTFTFDDYSLGLIASDFNFAETLMWSCIYHAYHAWYEMHHL